MYSKGDILADFRRRVIFIFPGPENFPLEKLYKCRILTPGETIIYNRHFKNRQEVFFSDFKKHMKSFDCRKLRNIIYGHIPLSEHDYIFFRGMQTSIPGANLQEKLSVLIINYLNPAKHNEENGHEIRAYKELKRLLSDILKDTNEK